MNEAINRDNNILAIKRPDLIEEWDYDKNKHISPQEVKVNSAKKVWWKCEKGHEWNYTIAKRHNGDGCPYCSGHKVCDDNNLTVTNTELVNQWNYEKNGELQPINVVRGSQRKVWWICERGHEWEASVLDRSSGRGCPYCKNKKVCDDNSLVATNPDLAKQWNYERNGALLPSDITKGSNKKVWWVCEKGHEWEAVISGRNLGSGCPICNNQTSFPEQAIFYYLSSAFTLVLNRHKIDGKEVDIFIEDINLAIEYDGEYFHSTRKAIVNDEKKNKMLSLRNIGIIRIREEGCPSINMYGANYLNYKYDSTSYNNLEKCIKDLFELLTEQHTGILSKEKNEKICKVKDSIRINEQVIEIISLFQFKESEKSLSTIKPELIK